MRTLEQLENYLVGLRNENRNGLMEASKNIAVTQEAIDKAQDETATAQVENNLEAFNKAKDKLWTASNSLDFYKRQHDTLKKPIVSEEEGKKLFDEIDNAAELSNEVLYERARNLVNELQTISEKVLSNMNQGSSLYSILQKDILKDNRPGHMKEFKTRSNSWFLKEKVEAVSRNLEEEF
ncbi:hypothetical protein UAS_00572 [Enterococcus asini ATCC 700915]|uniref:Uncharacterized protein n=1 Tax=Enterococcus asini ATCC 700915 TaxID=1158606 RepID=R2Q2C3_9ENTE|nr:hypothetical protein [Enterococcus asini]EOH89458.1 hypothetical protein UAS_00572 [Enterococcus asini ATCC 700915]EOT56523.1 hypothetical protein I579_00022 [Enterococcus asini ATCC 700915]